MVDNNNTLVEKSPLQHLDDMELLVLQGNHLAAGHAFLELLTLLSGYFYAKGWQRNEYTGDPVVTPGEACERAVLLWREVLSSDADLLQLNPSLMVYGLPMLHALMMGTDLGSMDDFIMAQHNECGGNYDQPRILRLLLAWNPNSRVGLNIFDYYKEAPELVLGQAVATLSDMSLVADAANEARNAAIDLLLRDDIDIADLARLGMGRMLLDAWMRCSYAEHPRKHHVKRFLSQVVMESSRLIRQTGKTGYAAEAPTALKGTPDKPVMVIPLESFQGGHAMFRCYAELVDACRNHFYTVGIAAESTYDEHTATVFDEFHDVKDIVTGWNGKTFINVEPVVTAIKSWSPEVVFYPSVGMAQWVVELAQERLAPVQGMMFGHPATSMSPAMDYALMYERYVGSPDCLSEKPVYLPDGVEKYRLPPIANRLQPIETLVASDVVRVAIPSVSQKLSAGFISALRYAQENSTRKVEYVFFLGADSIVFPACQKNIERELRNTICYPFIPYNDYILALNSCHLHAGSFPFGGTNSLIDSLRQGLPILVYEGDEPHSRIDADFLRRVKMPESFICHSAKEYGERLLELLENPAELSDMRRYLLNDIDVDRVFMQEGKPEILGETLVELVAEAARTGEGLNGTNAEDRS